MLHVKILFVSLGANLIKKRKVGEIEWSVNCFEGKLAIKNKY